MYSRIISRSAVQPIPPLLYYYCWDILDSNLDFLSLSLLDFIWLYWVQRISLSRPFSPNSVRWHTGLPAAQCTPQSGDRRD